MMETLKELKAIIAGKPDGATIIDIESDGFIDYLYCDDNAPSGKKIKSYSNVGDSAIEYSNGNIRSLSDIERIIELMERVKLGHEAYARIEAIKQRYNGESKYKTNLLIDAEILLRGREKEKCDNLADIIKETLK